MLEQIQVRKGEDLGRLLTRIGLPHLSTRRVVEQPENRDLFDPAGGGRSPSLLHEGDLLAIPELVVQQLPVATGARHRFALGAARRLNVTLRDSSGGSVAERGCQLRFEGAGADWVEVRTDGDGRLSAPIPAAAEFAELRVGGRTMRLRIAHLDPVETVAGVQGRLNNLGFPAGPVDGLEGPKTRAAVESFQAHRGISADGIVGPVTRKNLVEAYGC